MNDSRPDEHLLRDAAELILVTAGEAGGAPHETTLKFAYRDGVVYLLTTQDAAWYRHVARDAGVVVRIGRRGFRGRARLIDARQRVSTVNKIITMFKAKYGAGTARGLETHALAPAMIDMQF
jgi:hypothetical protein